MIELTEVQVRKIRAMIRRIDRASENLKVRNQARLISRELARSEKRAKRGTPQATA